VKIDLGVAKSRKEKYLFDSILPIRKVNARREDLIAAFIVPSKEAPADAKYRRRL
jgi:hypothetical protein